MTFHFFGHKILETIYESNGTIVYRAINESTNRHVILKVTKKEEVESIESKSSHLLEKDIFDILKKQDETTKTKSSQGIPEFFGIEEVGDENILIIQDCGKSLSQTLEEKGPYQLKDFLKIAIKVTQILGDIHQHQVIHKDIKPANILLDPEENKFFIIDFNISSVLSVEKENIASTKIMEGSLPYMSPEQTGRMNRSIDYRTDFYSLGITFFQLLTGKPPFISDETLDMVHFHIAKQTPSIRAVNPKVPEQIEKIIFKLTNKNAEDRYQTAYGLLKDLEKCEELLVSKKEIPLFPLGTHDVSGSFHLPQKLYGRDEDVKKLLETFENISKGEKAVLTITGVSGIGKTSLVNEVHRPIVAKYGLFLSGKFEQFKREIPYSALKHSFSELTKQVTVMSNEKIENLKNKLKESLGPYGRILTDFAPPLKFLFGELPEVEELPPTEALGRFNLNVLKFFDTITKTKHPIVMFIDDLQWADSASLDLFRNLIFSEELKNFLFIGAYRDNEVEVGHPLLNIFEKIKETNLSFHEIKVLPFTLHDIQELLFDMFKWPYDNTKNLSETILNKTRGNPFFVTEFIKSLHDNKLIYFTQEEGKWFFDEVGIIKFNISENVVDLMLSKLKMLTNEQQDLIMLGSCLGTEFQINHLSVISHQPLQKIAHTFWQLIKDGFIIPMGVDYSILQGISGSNESSSIHEEDIKKINIRYRFVHDRIQQAANELISAEEKKVVYLKLARLLLATLDDNQIDEKIFDIVNYYNHGKSLIENDEEIQHLGLLNFQTAKKALKNMAFGPALKYVTISLETFGTNFFEKNFEKYYTINLLHIECLYLNQKFVEAKKAAIDLLFKTEKPDQKVDIYLQLLIMHSTQSLNREATEYALSAMKLLGLSERINAGRVRFVLVYIITLFKLRNLNFESLATSPQITDKKSLKILQVLSAGAPSCYLQNVELLLILIFRCLTTTYKYGITAEFTFMVGAFADIEIFFRFRFQKAYFLFNKVLKLIGERFPEDKAKGRHGLILQYTASRFNLTIQQGLQLGEEATNASLNAGDSTYACTNSSSNSYTYSLYGVSATNLLKLGTKAEQLAEKHKVFDMIWAAKISKKLAESFLGKTKQIGSLDSETFLESSVDTELNEGHHSMRIICSTMQMLNKIVSGKKEDYQYILNWLKINWDFPLVLAGSIGVFAGFTYLCLSFAGLASKTSYIKKIFWRFIAYFGTIYTYFHYKNNPANFGVFYYLIKASRYMMSGNLNSANILFEKAKDHAISQGQLLYAALSLELIGRNYLTKQKYKKAYYYLHESAHYYDLFGAPAKVEDMAKVYGGSVEKFFIQKKYVHVKQRKSSEQNSVDTISVTQTSSVTSTTLQTQDLTKTISQANDSVTLSTLSKNTKGTNPSTGTGDSMIDFETFFKSSQVLSQEIQPTKILTLMMDILLKNSGATKIILLELNKENNHFFVAAKADINDESKDSENHDKNSSYQPGIDLPETIVKMVLDGNKTFISGNVSKENDLQHDIYVENINPKSILAMPILKNEKLNHILYLENKIMSDAFTSDRVHLLELLVAQMSISIENATLYEHLEEKVKERTLELRLAQQKLVSMAHKSGMADIASDILHNIGNILPSFYYFVNEFDKVKAKNLWQNFDKILSWLKTLNDMSWNTFYNEDPKGQKILPIIAKLKTDALSTEEKLKSLSEKLLSELSKIETVIKKHSQEDEVKNFNSSFLIKDIIEEIRQLYPNLASGKSINFRTEFDENLKIYNDQQKIQIIISEIIKNAHEELTALNQVEKTLKFNCEIVDNKIELIIEDNGRGIPKEIIQKLYSSDSNGFTTKSSSSGLGLKDSLELIKSISGTLEIDNLEILGLKGTRFTIKIPIINESESQPKVEETSFKEAA